MTANSSASQSVSQTHHRLVGGWLLIVALLVGLMVIVGGATRLTDSGLSITEWNVVTGIVPPLSDAAWEAELDKYRTIPEYRLINRGMTLDQFKAIYWWEWGHRLLGRFIGLVFLVPFVFFIWRGWIERERLPRLALLFVLGGAQGALGWFMVMSGLADRVDVSQYRLAAHLGLAFLIYGALLWTALDYFKGSWSGVTLHKRGVTIALALTTLAFLQIVIGGFVAGLDAGFAYNTWPLMDGGIVPSNLWVQSPWVSNLFENPATVQFAHRIMAYVLLVAALMVWFQNRGRGGDVARASIITAAAVLLQAVLGVWTLVAVVPIALGLLHQAGALIVIGSCVFLLHTANRSSAV